MKHLPDTHCYVSTNYCQAVGNLKFNYRYRYLLHYYRLLFFFVSHCLCTIIGKHTLMKIGMNSKWVEGWVASASRLLKNTHVCLNYKWTVSSLWDTMRVINSPVFVFRPLSRFQPSNVVLELMSSQLYLNVCVLDNEQGELGVEVGEGGLGGGNW